MGLSSTPATNAAKGESGRKAGELVVDLLRKNILPSKIITRASIENAIAGVAATGGSTNAVLHLLAIASEAKLPLSIDDFDRISSRVPILADLKPGGRFVATDLYAAGGTALVAKRLLEAGILRGDSITVTGRTYRRRSQLRQRNAGPGSRPQAEAPLKPTGGLVILKGNLAPEGCVIKVAGHDRVKISAALLACSTAKKRHFTRSKMATIKAGDVVVIRYEGPKGGPGMREMLAVTAALVGAGLGDSVALLTDGRFSGATHGLHGRARRAGSRQRRAHRRRCAKATPSILICPSANIESGNHRGGNAKADLAQWRAPAPRYTSGVMAKYAFLVSSSALGAITAVPQTLPSTVQPGTNARTL